MLQKTQIRLRYVIFCLLFCVIFWSIESCKKTDSLVSASKKETIVETPENFFNLPENASPVLKRIAKELERQNKSKEFIKAFIAKEGFPVWGKSRIERQRKNSTISDFDGDGLEDTTVYIPLVVSADHYVTGFLKATVDDSVDIKIFRQNDYANFPFKTPQSSTSVTTAEEFALRMMSMDRDVFGSTTFKLKDKRMFNNSTDYSDTGSIQRFVTLNDSSEKESFADGTTISKYQYEVCWSIDIVYYICGSSFSGSGNNTTSECGYYTGVLTNCTTYETGGGSGSSGGGNPGGGNPGSGTWPFPPSGGGSGGAPCEEFGASITNSFVPIECNTSGNNPWPSGNLDTWLDNIWLTYNVKDSTGDPCIRKALDTLKSIQQRLPTLIRSFFSVEPPFEMTFKIYTDNNWTSGGSFPSPPEGAYTTVANNTTNMFNVNINKYYSDCTDLGLAATIIHETLHCYIRNCYRLAYFSPDSTAVRMNLASQYGYLFPPLPINPGIDSVLTNIINDIDRNSLQHQNMVTRYKNDIANTLLQFATAKGINVDLAYCQDLAWTGCTDSKAFRDLSFLSNGATIQTRIMDRCLAEKDPYSSLTTVYNSLTYTVNANDYPEKGHPCH